MNGEGFWVVRAARPRRRAARAWFVRLSWLGGIAVLLAAVGLIADAAEPAGPGVSAAPFTVPPAEEDGSGRLNVTDPVVCETIRGFRDYDVREDTKLAEDEKLYVYVEPLNYLIRRDPETKRYRADLRIGAKLREHGSERVLRHFENLLTYAPEDEEPPTAIFLGAIVSLLEIPKGDYDLELIVTDRLCEAEPTISRVVRFQVVAEAP